MSRTARFDAEELAGLLPDGMSCNNARERLLCVLQALLCLTDDSHALSNAQLRAVLAAYFGPGFSAAENTIAADLSAIAGAGCLGVSLHVTPSGSWVERTELTPQKVRLLLNAVQSSTFLTKAQGADLQVNLYDLVSRHQEDSLSGTVVMGRRERKPSQEVLATIDAVTRAVDLHRKVEFEYTYTSFRGDAVALPGEDGATVRVETPISVCFSEGNYYVETYASTPWRHGVGLMRSRADRMVGTRVSDQPAERSREVADLRRSAQRRADEGFQMIDGRMRRVFLRVRSDMTNVMFDQFGYGVRFGPREGAMNDPAATALTMLLVPQAFTFFRWLSSAGSGIVMVEPPSELGLATGPWKRTLEGVGRDELVADWREMVQAYLAFLDRARAPYV